MKTMLTGLGVIVGVLAIASGPFVAAAAVGGLPALAGMLMVYAGVSLILAVGLICYIVGGLARGTL